MAIRFRILFMFWSTDHACCWDSSDEHLSSFILNLSLNNWILMIFQFIHEIIQCRGLTGPSNLLLRVLWWRFRCSHPLRRVRWRMHSWWWIGSKRLYHCHLTIHCVSRNFWIFMVRSCLWWLRFHWRRAPSFWHWGHFPLALKVRWFSCWIRCTYIGEYLYFAKLLL